MSAERPTATAAYDPDDDLYALGVCTDNPPVCKVCDARDKAIADGKWNVGFRTCPHCGATWRH